MAVLLSSALLACAAGASDPACGPAGCPADAPDGGRTVTKHGRTWQVPPATWGYPGLPPGPYTTTDYPFAGWPGYRGARGNLVAHPARPAVPVYGPLPAVYANPDPPPHPHRRTLGFGVGYYGWVGPYRASPRLTPQTVGVWPANDPRAAEGHRHHRPVVAPVPPPPGCGADGSGCLRLAVTVPHPSAEVYVDGVKTAQVGTGRVFESPELAAGATARYELTARWAENGRVVERRRAVAGRPGEVVRVDFTAAAEVVPAGR